LRRLSKFLIVLSMLFCIETAHATPITQNFSFTTAPVNGSVTYAGVLILSGTTDPFDGTAIDVTSVGGSINGQSVSLVPLTGAPNTQVYGLDPKGLFFANDVYYKNGTPYDVYGLLFTDGTNLYNFVGGGVFVWVPSPLPGLYLSEVPITIASPVPHGGAATPEPTTLALCGTGILAIAGLARRRRIKS
jgi:hypothetical protein